ncbi:hypothetical protein A2482_04305 [Candidatus Falkowbacteria bacterium RIFOXYC2_FULL_48_21]|uniref:Uncharacterized protein n=1 Tax=Candidatus Falkowbacteria bacterium RIFOXYC2_FULL_48_21 TaxID=1798005 RepID=A0A1F5TGW3_9BACT|nr:MAG: hypothetical protein A2482_04305 [Candidatus Falkowbacteria bacterium RIFOXYC2_FULL_48_21]
MENELLEKSIAELRLARAAVERMHEEHGSERVTAEQALDMAKCQLAMAIVLAGGSNWVIQRHLHLFMLVKVVRGLGCLDLAEADVIPPREAKCDSLRRLFNLLKDKADDAAVAAALMEMRMKFGDPLRTCDNMVAIRGRFFRFADDKYEVME